MEETTSLNDQNGGRVDDKSSDMSGHERQQHRKSFNGVGVGEIELHYSNYRLGVTFSELVLSINESDIAGPILKISIIF